MNIHLSELHLHTLHYTHVINTFYFLACVPNGNNTECFDKGPFSCLVYVHHNQIKTNVREIDTSGTTLMYQLELSYVYRCDVVGVYNM